MGGRRGQRRGTIHPLGSHLLHFRASDVTLRADTMLSRSDSALALELGMLRSRSKTHLQRARSNAKPSVAARDDLRAVIGPAAYAAEAQALLQLARPAVDAAIFEAVDHVHTLVWLNSACVEDLELLEREGIADCATFTQNYLQIACSSRLTATRHRRMARAIGRSCELLGLPMSLLLEALWLALQILHQAVAHLPWAREQRAHLAAVLSARVRDALHAINDGQHELSTTRHQLIIELEQWRTTAGSWDAFAIGAMERLSKHPGMVAIAIGKPDPDARIVYEFESPRFVAYLAEVQRRGVGPLSMDASNTFGQSPQARAWRSRDIEINHSYLVDAGAGPWAQAAHAVGIHASTALPIIDSEGEPAVLLALYGALPGQFGTQSMGLFLQALRQVFSQAYVELGQLGRAHPPPVAVRRRQLQLLSRGAVQMAYQPIVNLATGVPTAVEALARLVSDHGRLIAPAEFLGSFGRPELNRLFVLGLQHALHDLAIWDQAGVHLSVTLNLPPSVLVHRDCLRWVIEGFVISGVNPDRLMLELLESEDAAASNQRDDAINRLAALGVKLIMDDFGSGYSNLWRMRSMPFDAVKLDQSLLTELSAEQPRTVRFLAGLIEVVQGLGLRAVVEGLSSPELVALACILGADAGQGYALSHPLPATEVPVWMHNFSWAAINPAQPLGELGALAAQLARSGAGHRGKF
ncbi:MAG: EAL domain-containing protein [Metallibacterium sp.]